MKTCATLGHKNDGGSSSSGSFSEEEIDSGVVTGQKKHCIRFTQAQRACLLKYWSNGLTGCGRCFGPQISRAATDTGLSRDQVKQCTKSVSTGLLCTELLDYSVLAYWVPLYWATLY